MDIRYVSERVQGRAEVTRATPTDLPNITYLANHILQQLGIGQDRRQIEQQHIGKVNAITHHQIKTTAQHYGGMIAALLKTDFALTVVFENATWKVTAQGTAPQPDRLATHQQAFMRGLWESGQGDVEIRIKNNDGPAETFRAHAFVLSQLSRLPIRENVLAWKGVSIEVAKAFIGMLYTNQVPKEVAVEVMDLCRKYGPEAGQAACKDVIIRHQNTLELEQLVLLASFRQDAEISALITSWLARHQGMQLEPRRVVRMCLLCHIFYPDGVQKWEALITRRQGAFSIGEIADLARMNDRAPIKEIVDRWLAEIPLAQFPAAHSRFQLPYLKKALNTRIKREIERGEPLEQLCLLAIRLKDKGLRMAIKAGIGRDENRIFTEMKGEMGASDTASYLDMLHKRF